MEKGEVQFGILAPPFDLIAEKRGYEMLLALPGSEFHGSKTASSCRLRI